MKPTTEAAFEGDLEAHLLAHGYVSGQSSDYDAVRGILPGALVEFIQATQAKRYAQVEAVYNDQAEAQLLASVCKAMDRLGSLAVLRKGFKCAGKRFELAYFAPDTHDNPDTLKAYGQNRLTVVRQLFYDPAVHNSIDIVLFLNGVPVVTAELKNEMTGQAEGEAVKQYKTTRDPKVSIFKFSNKAGPLRALVHFAVSTDAVRMTTQLAKTSTRFLPFDQGNQNGAGNPLNPNGQRTAYLWEKVWARDSLLELIGQFLHLRKHTPKKGDKPATPAVLICPRYHQRECVRDLVKAARDHGAGKNYLVQHSAGSGKSNSIAWLAHQLASLHDAQDAKVYHQIIVMTDRRVLDKQLQDTIASFEHPEGVIERIRPGYSKSGQLAAALQSEALIIICTIHSFGAVQDLIEGLPDRRYAIIVDEAHSSQSGEMAVDVKSTLAGKAVEEGLADADDLALPLQLAMRKALERGKQPNLSFFAFTATPKAKTLALFGHMKGGQPAPFHLYSMRQAIEEGFILDVLRGYITWDRYFKLAKQVAADPKLDKRKAARALTRFVNLHPTNIAQKTDVIISHFRDCVMGELNGRAKAMLVTSSRLLAVRYALAFKAHIKAKGYTDMACMVAFSGEVDDGIKYTEAEMNGVKDTRLPKAFRAGGPKVLIVANKYQTGFDEPLLVAMYVDKRLAGVQAVQTLSRLNRIAPEFGKTKTFVLDFVNRRDDILAAFQDYYEQTTTEPIDPDRLQALSDELDGHQVYTPSEVQGFAGVFFKLPNAAAIGDNAKLNKWLDPGVDRFKALVDDEQGAFRTALSAYCTLYSFLGQTIPFADAELEALFAYGRMLLRKLPHAPGSGPLMLDNDVALANLVHKKQAEGDLALQKGSVGNLKGPSGTGTGSADTPEEELSKIIELLNDRFGLGLPEHSNKLLDGIHEALVDDPEMKQAAEANSQAHFAHLMVPRLEDLLLSHHAENGQFVEKVFDHEKLRKALYTIFVERIYKEIRTPAITPDAEPLPFPLPRVTEGIKPGVNCIPVLDLKVAAGDFSPTQITDPGAYDWVDYGHNRRDLFVAQVVGKSMNQHIADGAWCVWRATAMPADGAIVLAQLRGQSDAEGEGSYTVKRFSAQQVQGDDGVVHTASITLTPQSTDPAFKPMTFSGLPDGDLQILAELAETIPPQGSD